MWSTGTGTALLRRTASFTLALAALMLFSTAVADSTGAETDPPGDAGATEAIADVCHPYVDPAEPLVDRMQVGLYRTVCVTARWFDSLFGERLPFAHQEDVYGRLRLGAEYTEFDGFDPKLRLRANIPLPNVSDRLNAFVGRVDEDTYIRDQETPASGAFAEGFQRRDAEWLLGLGYRPESRTGHDWDWSVGVRIRTPLNPYVKGKYAYIHPFGDRRLLRYRQTVFWENDDGLGTTTNLAYDHTVAGQHLLRVEGIGTYAEGTEGLDWWAGTTFYQQLQRQRAIAWLAFARGESQAPESLREYGVRVTYRRPLNRDYLFLELGPSVTWPREEPDQDRELSLGFGVIVEMQFGEFRY